MNFRSTKSLLGRAERHATEMLAQNGIPADAETGLALMALGVLGVLNGGVPRSALGEMLESPAVEFSQSSH